MAGAANTSMSERMTRNAIGRQIARISHKDKVPSPHAEVSTLNNTIITLEFTTLKTIISSSETRIDTDTSFLWQLPTALESNRRPPASTHPLDDVILAEKGVFESA